MKKNRLAKLPPRPTAPAAARKPAAAARGRLIGAAAILALTILGYLPALRAGFVWDDDKMLTSNVFVQVPAGLYYIWCTTTLPDYFPLTSSSFWLEWRLWGLNPLGYHITNVLLHAGSACLLWRVLMVLRVPGAWLAALVFAVHPVNVQSVAWITERKNTLCMFFALLSLLWYLRSEEASSHPPRNPNLNSPRPSPLAPRPFYALSLLAFLLALLSKTAVVMLPFVLLLCAWWRRTGAPSATLSGPRPSTFDPRLLLRLVPFFALSLGLGLVTLWFQSHRAIAGDVIRADDFPTRLAAAGQAVCFYARKILVPLDLCFVYPTWKTESRAILSWLPLAGLLIAFAGFWRFRRSWGRPLLFALGCFVLMLLPILGLVDIYFHRYSLVADHWTYFASIAIIVLFVGVGAHWFSRLKSRGRWLLPIGAIAAVAWLAAATWRQAGVYHDPRTLWEDTLAKNHGCWLAHNSLGSALAGAGRLDEARARYEQALALKPDSAELLNNVASMLLEQGKTEEAIGHLRKALEISPRSAMAYYNLGNAYDRQSKTEEAAASYRKALELDPDHAEAHSNLGCLLYAAGKTSEAIEEFNRAISLRPDYAEALNNLAAIFLELDRPQEAESLLVEALRHKPAYPDGLVNLGNALLNQGRIEEAAAACRRALALNPNLPKAHSQLGTALWYGGDAQAALQELTTALNLQPDLPEAHYQAGAILLAGKKHSAAIASFRRAAQLKTNWPEALASLGFALATAPSAVDRDNLEAMEIATRAVELTHSTNFNALDALAAASAGGGHFDDAARLAGTAADLALAARQTNQVERILQRQRLYEAGQPYRD